jgi:16S rRNA (cytidine1402-2'-O)-methyltransferase
MRYGNLSELAARYADLQPKGEIVIVVGSPALPEAATDEQLDAALGEALTRLSASRAAAEVAEKLSLPRKRAYARALELTK